MNFYNEDEKKDGAPIAPGAGFKKTSAFGKSPLFSRTAGGIMDRLKNLSRKDLAFVGIGMSVLVMAPVAEYMMSKPSPENMLTGGFGQRSSASGGAPNGLYEPGINALSQGSPDGSGEVITPLSSRDPASLILGAQPATPAAPPPAPPASSFRDSMKDVGRAAFSEAAKAAPSPTPVPRMQSALRSFGSFFGGGENSRTSGSLGGGKIIDDAKSASGKSAKRSMVGPVATPGYKGVASNTPNSSSKGAFEKLRAASDRAASNFGGGSAIGSLDKAAADSVNLGAGGGGLGYGGDSEKTGRTSNSNNKYDHSRSGESLAEMAAKQRQQKALEWEFYKQYEIPKKIIEAILTGITGPLTKMVDGSLSHVFGLDAQPKPTFCWQPAVCPDGNCAEMVKQYKKVAAVDLCYDPGAQKFAWEAAGKDKGSGAQVNCICGKANQPIGKEYSPGGTPPAGPQNPGGPAVPGTPQAISNDAAKLFTDYDKAFDAVIDSTLLMEKALSDGQPVKDLTDLAGNVQKLEAVVPVVAQKLGETNSSAVAANLKYRDGILTAKGDYAAAERANLAYQEAVKKILADGANMKVSKDVKAGGPAVAEKTAGAADTAPNINADAVKKIIALYEAPVKENLANAKGKLEAEEFRFNAFNTELGQLKGAIGQITGAHTQKSGAMGNVLVDTSLPLNERLAKATGRTAVQPKGSAAAGTQKGAKETAAGTTPADKAPLRAIAEDIRGVKWDKLWPTEKRVYDSADSAAAENKVWDPYLAAVNAKQAAQITPTTNFVANAARSGAIQAFVASVDLSGISRDAKVAVGYIDQAKKDLAGIVDTCHYFGGTGCAGAGTTQPVDPNTGGTSVPGLNDVSASAANLAGDMAPQLKDAQARYNLVANSGKCTGDTCRQYLAAANGNLDTMKKYGDEVGRLQAELKPGISAERLSQVKERLGQVRAAMDRQNSQSEPRLFDANIKEAARLAKVSVPANPVTPVTPVTPVHPPKPKPAKLESYPDAQDAVKKASDARLLWMNAKSKSDGALDRWRAEEDSFNKLLDLGKKDPLYGVKHPGYTAQLLKQKSVMNQAAENYKSLQPATDRAYQTYWGAFTSAKALLDKYKLPQTYLPR
ncbi:MAG: hypothetical protein HY952_01730 [Elusimicrobia bacterium]|nr:hypothetical protein [Elusimicrobiota bacterium]